MENFHLQNTDIKMIICDLGAHCLNRIPFIFWPVHLNNRIHLQTEIAVCLLSVKYKCSSKEKTSCSIPVSNSKKTSQISSLLLEACYQSQSQAHSQWACQVPAHLQGYCCLLWWQPGGRLTRQESNKDLLNGKFRNETQQKPKLWTQNLELTDREKKRECFSWQPEVRKLHMFGCIFTFHKMQISSFIKSELKEKSGHRVEERNAEAVFC